MIPRPILEQIEHKEPNQLTLLAAPNDVEMFEATQLTTHHIIVDAKQPPHQFMKGRGWFHTPTRLFGEKYFHYTPKRLKAEKWQDLWGCYHYAEHTQKLIHRLNDESIVIDIGTYHGKCAAHMAHLTKEMGKDITIYTVDPYGWAPEYKPHPPLSWHRNIKTWQDIGLNNWINSLQMTSTNAARFFEDESVTHVHLDGITTSPKFVEDLDAWIPKLQPRGSIDGINYSNEHVKKQVDRRFDNVFVKEDLDIWIGFKHHLK